MPKRLLFTNIHCCLKCEKQSEKTILSNIWSGLRERGSQNVISNWHVSKSHSYWVLEPRSIALCNFVNPAFRREQCIVVTSIWKLEHINLWYCLRQTHARVWSFLGQLGQIAQSNLFRKVLYCFVRRNRWTCITMQQFRNFQNQIRNQIQI